MMSETVVHIQKLEHRFGSDSSDLNGGFMLPELVIKPGERILLTGSSGCGKSTLIGLLSGILAVQKGSVQVCRQELFEVSESKRDRFRGVSIGLLFQRFHLMKGLTALENVALPSQLHGKPDSKTKAQVLLDQLDCGHLSSRFPHQLSVGQQQRIALARALIHKPQLVLADEPTASLDPELSESTLRLISERCKASRASLLLVSHDQHQSGQFDRHINWDDLTSTHHASQG
jgi:putative ABC transport system ATP-binding protein